MIVLDKYSAFVVEISLIGTLQHLRLAVLSEHSQVNEFLRRFPLP